MGDASPGVNASARTARPSYRSDGGYDNSNGGDGNADRGDANPNGGYRNPNADYGGDSHPRPLGSPALREPPPVARRALPPPTQAAPPVARSYEQAPASAREACGKRVFIALAICMNERCAEPRYRNSAECVALAAERRERANP